LSLYFGWFILECAIQAPSILEEEISHLDDLICRLEQSECCEKKSNQNWQVCQKSSQTERIEAHFDVHANRSNQ
jgi:hypothetical protein